MLEFSASDWEGLEGMAEEALEILREPAEIAIIDATEYLAEQVRVTLGPDSGPRTGRLYKVSKRGPLHQASAPGQPPAVLFGMLRRSITRSEPEWDRWTVAAWIGTALEYAMRLEYGGIDSRGVRILPRPYLEPTVLREMEKVEAILEAGLARVA